NSHKLTDLWMNVQTSNGAAPARGFDLSLFQDRRIEAARVDRITKNRTLRGHITGAFIEGHHGAVEIKERLVQRRLLRLQSIEEESIDLLIRVLGLWRLMPAGNHSFQVNADRRRTRTHFGGSRN